MYKVRMEFDLLVGISTTLLCIKIAWKSTCLMASLTKFEQLVYKLNMEFDMFVGISTSSVCLKFAWNSACLSASLSASCVSCLHGIRHGCRHLCQPLVYKAFMEFDKFVGISTSSLCIKFARNSTCLSASLPAVVF